MRILFLTPQLPTFPPRQGTTIRNFNLIAGLARRHRVHLLSFVTPEDDLAAAKPLQEACEAVETVPQPVRTVRERLWTTFTSPLPDMAHRLFSPLFLRALDRVLTAHSFDIIEFEGIEMIPYLPTVLERARNAGRSPHLVFDDHNAEYVLQKRVFEMDVRLPLRWPGAAYSFLQWQKLKRYEAWACRSVDTVVAVSEIDAKALRRIVPEREIVVVPNGVDIVYYDRFSASPALLGDRSLVFTGKMDFRPNIDAVLWFAESVLPVVREQVPEACFYIVGQKPHARLDRLREVPGIVITGEVPDIRPYIAGAAVYVIPLRSGGGTRLKVLEAMAMRRPIVSTSMGCDGFPVTSGQEVVLADDPREFAHGVIALLRDHAQRDALGQAAFSFAAARYDWPNILPLLERTYPSERATS